MATMLGNTQFGSREKTKRKGTNRQFAGNRMFVSGGQSGGGIDRATLAQREAAAKTSDFGYLTSSHRGTRGRYSENYIPKWVDTTGVQDLVDDPYLREIFKGMGEHQKVRYAMTHAAELREFRKGFKQRKRDPYSARASAGGGTPGGRTLLTRSRGVPDSQLNLGQTLLGGQRKPLGY